MYQDWLYGQCIGRIGNFINIEAYGTETKLPWRMGIVEGGRYIEVHPTFLYEMIATMAIVLILILKKDKRKYKGELTYLYLIIYGFFRMLIEGLRIDSLMILQFRVSQVLSGVFFVVFSVFYLYKRQKAKKM